ncbi:glutamate 5-kinase [Kibdelosporangium banguiense]|uniref:Glutamate 5-kinase n=1 Tax=Kibdelosporangium banguiense TaxID=1365924 RepID=A0ABS4T746_9PSEU|nr:glutamate 5-kinase [Kibdelosporangium banguiense]MBP2319764.1 glutamate 5-kinase [Kibdelosporangium banguiense]
MTTSPTRKALVAANRIVVKVGSSSLTTAEGGLDPARLDALVDALAARRAAGSQVVLVSSGAIAAGLAPLGIARRPRDLATQQAAASVGQLALAHAYAASFARYSLTVGQVLLTADDVVRRSHYRNAQRTFSKLLALDTVPVVNENDTVATEEIRFGDNDRLAALVAHLVGADGLFLLSDVDGLYSGDPRVGADARLIEEVTGDSDVDGVRAGAIGASGLGTGGMASKLAAARLASSAGIPVLLAAAAQVPQALAGADVGTAFAATGTRLSARRFWLGHAAGATGKLRLDDGAVAAVVHRRRSLLSAGITAVEGEFDAGDVVELVDLAGNVVARGVVAFDAAELPALIGRSTHELPAEQRREVVHADDLVPIRTF